MKMLMYSTLGVLLLAGSAVAQPKKAAGEDVATTLKALEEKWVQAQLKGDVAALGSVLADGFVSTGSTGELRSKAETLDMLKSGALKLQTSKIDDLRVMVFGDAAVVIGRWQGKGTEKGKPLDDTERFTDTWIKQGGQWRCVASQGTLVKKK
jgi:ketosteroid isomerase-like protein